jgi:hypothetical protein
VPLLLPAGEYMLLSRCDISDCDMRGVPPLLLGAAVVAVVALVLDDGCEYDGCC